MSRPKTVLVKTVQPSSTIASATTKIAGTPSSVAVPKSLNTFGNWTSVRESVTSSAAPRAILSIPSVTIKEGTLQKLETKPLIKPQIMPTTTLTATAAVIAAGTGSNSLFSTKPATIAHNAMTDPTDKSIPPIRITKVIPVAMMRLIVICVRMLVILDSSVK